MHFEHSPVATLNVIIRLVLLLTVPIGGASVSVWPTDMQISQASTVARCRAGCMDAFRSVKIDQRSLEDCRLNRNCGDCWTHCELFQDDRFRSSACSRLTNPKDRHPACEFYSDSLPLSYYYRRYQWSFPMEYNIIRGPANSLSWPPVVPLTIIAPPLPSMVYVLFGQREDGVWTQLEQTQYMTYQWLVYENDDDYKDFFVMAVSHEGMVATLNSGDRASGSRTHPLLAVKTVKNSDQSRVQFGHPTYILIGFGLLAGVILIPGLVFLWKAFRRQEYAERLFRSNAFRFKSLSDEDVRQQNLVGNRFVNNM